MRVLSPIETSRLSLLPGKNRRDNRAFLRMLKEDGDFSIFAGVEENRYNLREYNGYLERAFNYAIYRKGDLSELLGYIGLGQRGAGSEAKKYYEVDFYIKRSERRKGFCTEALHALCKAAFAGELATKKSFREKEPLLLDKIYASVIQKNTASIALMEKSGFSGTDSCIVFIGDSGPAKNKKVYALPISIYELENPQAKNREDKNDQKRTVS